MLAILLQLIDDPEDKRKIEDLYSRYERLMFVVARDILKDPYKAEDAVNDAFINIIKNFEKIDAVDSPRTKRFLVIIVRNICFNLLKKDKRHPEVLFDYVSEIDQHAAPAAIAAAHIIITFAIMPSPFSKASKLPALQSDTRRYLSFIFLSLRKRFDGNTLTPRA